VPEGRSDGQGSIPGSKGSLGRLGWRSWYREQCSGLLSVLPYITITISNWSNLDSQAHPPPARSQPQTKTNIPSTHRRPNLPQTLAHPQNPIHKQTIGISLNLKVPKEGVCAEQAEHLVQRIVGLAIWLWRLGGREGWLGGESECRAAGARAEGEEGEVAD
jgi:hypothetical protein